MLALASPMLSFAVNDLHRRWGWWAVWAIAAVGAFGLLLAVLRRKPGKLFWGALTVGIVGLLTQVAMGYYSYLALKLEPGNRHIFYGVLILFTLAFAYIYRVQLAKRPGLYYGLLALFLMGLAMRAISGFGMNF